jgi:hypothetical protein
MQHALLDADSDAEDDAPALSREEKMAARREKRAEEAKIGHGKGRTLTEAARRKQM